jgi:hypothetical protein
MSRGVVVKSTSISLTYPRQWILHKHVHHPSGFHEAFRSSLSAIQTLMID